MSPGVSKPKIAEPTGADPTSAEPKSAEPTSADPKIADPTCAGPTIAEPTSDTCLRRHALVAAVLVCMLGPFAVACRVQTAPDEGLPLDAKIGGTLDCRQRPRFAAQAGFTAGSALSTGEGEMPGLVLVDVADPSQTYQHPSWARYGFLGPFTYDSEGNVFVAPTPNISLLENPPEEQNTIFKVDTDNGEMEEFLRLAPAGPLSADNPFGILGLTYDCGTDGLYASSVAGSSRRQEIGRIVRINPADGIVTDTLPDVDAMGLAVFRGSRDTRLYFGSARRSEVWSVALDERGGFHGPSRREFSLPGWSDKARRIVFDADGGMEILGVPFVFNLAVGLDAPENSYGFRYDPTSDTWQVERTQ